VAHALNGEPVQDREHESVVELPAHVPHELAAGVELEILGLAQEHRQRMRAQDSKRLHELVQARLRDRHDPGPRPQAIAAPGSLVGDDLGQHRLSPPKISIGP
jgi:hypothetical protein